MKQKTFFFLLFLFFVYFPFHKKHDYDDDMHTQQNRQQKNRKRKRPIAYKCCCLHTDTPKNVNKKHYFFFFLFSFHNKQNSFEPPSSILCSEREICTKKAVAATFSWARTNIQMCECEYNTIFLFEKKVEPISSSSLHFELFYLRRILLCDTRVRLACEVYAYMRLRACIHTHEKVVYICKL